MLPSLAFEKQEKIGECYDLIAQEIQNVKCKVFCLFIRIFKLLNLILIKNVVQLFWKDVSLQTSGKRN